MKVSLIRIPKDLSHNVPEKIIGMFVFENNRWEVYAPPNIKAKLDTIEDTHIEYCKESKAGIFRFEKVVKRSEKEWINAIHHTLRWDFEPMTFGTGPIESMSKEEVKKLKKDIVKEVT